VRRRDFIRIAAGAAAWPRLGASGVQVNTADTDSFRARLGEFYANWQEKAGPAAWRLLESYAGEIRR
jgi:hypothetical protein